ncbi:MAG: glutathione S-transferase family protein [Spongiibacteraceae bacterium]
MGLLVKGEWVDQWYDTESSGGEFIRQDSGFRHWVTADGAAGMSGEGGFKAESGRYHLYVSLACPWAHRTLIFRHLKGLTEHIGVSVVEPLMLDKGWVFAEQGDGLYGFECLHQLYTKSSPEMTGRVTVPMLWDKQQQVVVSNESAEIIRMFNSAFDGITGNTLDFYPEQFRGQIDELNAMVYSAINNGVYRAGFATSQQAYEKAYTELFDALDVIDCRLAKQRYLLGEAITEADWRLFTTLIRFDAVYFGHFKTNRQRISDYACLSQYLRDLYQQPGIAETVNMAHIKQHYYGSHSTINPSGVVPLGPDLNLDLAHQRATMF